MDKQMNVLVVILVVLISTLSCNKDENKPPYEGIEQIQYLKSALGGCNNNTEENIEFGEEKGDTVIVSFSDDTLKISAGLNYICCAPFKTDCEIYNDSVFITITDTCPKPNHCYCRCNCLYTFDYYFDNIADKEYYWQIILNDPREENQILFRNGKITAQKLRIY